MPTWLSLLGALFGTGAFFVGLYILICLVVAKGRRGAIPTIGVGAGESPGSLNFWVKWNSSAYLIEFYRIKVSHYSPERMTKEGAFSITLDPPQKSSFLQPVNLSQEFVDLLSDNTGQDSIVTIEARTTDNKMISRTFSSNKLRTIFRGNASSPRILNSLKVATPDVPSVSTLDYSELVERRQKLKSLADMAREKEKKTQAAAAAKAVPPVQPAKAQVQPLAAQSKAGPQS